MTHPTSAALPLAQTALRVLIVVNWVIGIGIALLLFVAPHEQWLMISLKLVPSPDTSRFIWGMRAVAGLALVCIPINHVVLSRLAAIVGTVRHGDAFVAANADRLQLIAWALLGLQLLSLVIGGVGAAISTPAHPLQLDAGFSPAGWLAVLLTFVLARIFAEGARMRDDLEGTV